MKESRLTFFLKSAGLFAVGGLRGSGHGGADFFTINAFLKTLGNGGPLPVGAMEAATWNVITHLSGKSILHGNIPVEFPDFTRI